MSIMLLSSKMLTTTTANPKLVEVRYLDPFSPKYEGYGSIANYAIFMPHVYSLFANIPLKAFKLVIYTYAKFRACSFSHLSI